MEQVRLGIVGCGAVTENFHLPAIRCTAGVSLRLLVDRDKNRAAQLGSVYGAAAAEDIGEHLDEVDAVIVAVPNQLHAQVAIGLLRAGKHVLVEKPMALSVAGCTAMTQAADEAGVVLAVGHVRRFYASSLFVKEVLASGILGDITRFDMSEGRVFRWPVLTDALFRKDLAGGGVLMDIGVHVADLALWWFGDWARLTYSDDNRGGVEADCELCLEMHSGVKGSICLSRLRDLSNRWVIEGERGRLELGPEFGSPVKLTLTSGLTALEGKASIPDSPATGSIIDAFRSQLADFVRAILTGSHPLVGGADGSRAIGLIEHSYRHRRPVEWAWRGLLDRSAAQGTAK